MPSFQDFVQSGTKGTLNKVFMAGYIADIARADNKFKAVLKTLKDFALYNTKLFLPVSFLTAWAGLHKSVRAILKDTGSLDAALRRMASIQGFQRTFAPLLGGLAAAKQRVAELIQLSARSPFRFEEMAGAGHSLEVMTRGAYSGKEALTTLGNAAAASGNGIEVTASAVGDFYAQLRSGTPIEGAAENLRQMGLISQGTANDLVQLSQHGATNQEVFDRLTKSLAGAAGAMKDMAGDVQAVQQASDKAAEGLQQAFGESFTSDHVTNIKNYAAAMQAITPMVGRLGSFLNILTGGFSTMRSSIVLAAAESRIFRGVIEVTTKALATLIVVGGMLAALNLGSIISSAGQGLAGLSARAVVASASMTGLTGTVARFGAKLLGVVGTGAGAFAGVAAIAGVVAVAAAGAGILMKYTAQINKETDAVLADKDAHAQLAAARKQEIKDIQTLAQWVEQLTKARNDEAEAKKKLAAIEARHTKEKEDLEKQIAKLPISTGMEERAQQRRQDLADRQSQEKDYIAAGQEVGEAGRARQKKEQEGPGANLAGQDLKELTLAAEHRRLQREEEEYQAKLATPGVDRVGLMRGHTAFLKQREEDAEAGRTEAQAVERRRAELAGQGADSEQITAVGLRTREDAAEEIKDLKKQLNAEIKQSGKSSPLADILRDKITKAEAEPTVSQTSSVFLTSQAKMFRKDNPKLAFQLDAQAAVAQEREQATEHPSIEAGTQTAAAARALQVTRTQQDLELQIQETRRRGDTQKSHGLKDELAFAKHYEENISSGMAGPEARERATQQTKADIFGDVNYRGLGQVADSLQAIGGGGGVYAPGDDPALQVQQRQEGLLQEIRDYLATISGKDNYGIE